MKIQGVIGALLMAVGGMCPLVHVPIIGNWNYFGIDQSLGVIFYVIIVLAFAGAFLNKIGLIRFSGWAAIAMVILTLAAVWFKSHDYFSFIHFKKLINLASGMVKYKWGWFVILAGVLPLITVRRAIGATQVSEIPVSEIQQ
ncbi:hypothetical protein [Pedobacter cryoconitis]|uniref:Uncharacterized protein n=1 Tax=Pedobacter cryoconitis TaxID=188932 RepID=A0A7X0MGD1_9SPHI|nr:hypothetical protein [Pedobacter cryoconitis]MBB6497959.1 hypothetical protein [Pedobacter cryoconitis]